MSDPRLSIIPAGAVTDTRLEPRDLQVLCLLGRHTDDNGWCSRSQVKMARELGCGRATVQRALERLADASWIEHRPEVRPDGGDRAHFYRVILDRKEEPKLLRTALETAAKDERGVPTGGQGVPTQDGQGVPTHERAPIRTTPINDSEREARAQPEDPRPEDDREFQSLLKRYPGVASPNLAFPPWLRLDDDGRRRALSRLDAYLAERRKLKNDTVFALQRYLAERLFDQVEEPPAGQAVMTTAKGRSKEFWWLVQRKAARGERTKVAFEMARDHGSGIPVSIAELRAFEEDGALCEIETGGEAFEAWRRWFESHGLRFRATDTHICGRFIYVPSEWPPGEGTRGSGAASDRGSSRDADISERRPNGDEEIAERGEAFT